MSVSEYLPDVPGLVRGRRKEKGQLEALTCVRPGAWLTDDGFYSIDRMTCASEYGPAGTWLVIANAAHPTREEYVEDEGATLDEARHRLVKLRAEDRAEELQGQ